MLLAYEDVHWIDPTTQELLGLVIERIQRLPVLVIITFRPEFQPALVGPAPRQFADADPARPPRRRGHVERVVGAESPCQTRSLDQIVAKTDGVPLLSRS